MLTSECGHTGKVYKTPIVLTRIGDVPPSVVLADPSVVLMPSGQRLSSLKASLPIHGFQLGCTRGRRRLIDRRYDINMDTGHG